MTVDKMMRKVKHQYESYYRYPVQVELVALDTWDSDVKYRLRICDTAGVLEFFESWSPRSVLKKCIRHTRKVAPLTMRNA